MSDSEEEPSRDFREAAALLADMALHVKAIVDKPGPDPMKLIRSRLQDAEEDMRRCGLTLVEIYHVLCLYTGMSEEETHAERRKYERAVRLQT